MKTFHLDLWTFGSFLPAKSTRRRLTTTNDDDDRRRRRQRYGMVDDETITMTSAAKQIMFEGVKVSNNDNDGYIMDPTLNSFVSARYALLFGVQDMMAVHVSCLSFGIATTRSLFMLYLASHMLQIVISFHVIILLLYRLNRIANAMP